jgi:hypothetical protein
LKLTEKLGLKKPELNDYVNIEDLNDNMDILDGEVGGLKEGSTTIEDLQTENKTLSGAINEVKSDLDEHKTKIATQEGRHGIRYWNDKLEIDVDGEWIEHKSSEGFKVGNVSNLKADEDDGTLQVSWQDPPDVYIEDSLGNSIKIATWAGTKLVINDTAFPINENDGTLLVDSTVRNQYKSNGFLIENLENDKTYYIALFPYTTEGVVTIDSANRIAGTPTEIDPNSWRGIQKIVRQGLASEYFSVGDQLVSLYDGKEIVWEVIGIDVDTPADSNYTHSMTLQTKDCLHNIQFDAKEPNNPNSDRKSYGNNRYIHSAVRQWLNSDEAAFQWKSQHQYDAEPTGSLDLYNGAGFLHRLDPELVAVIGEVSKKVALNTATDGGEQDTFTDKVFLLSQKEVGLGEEGDVAGEFVYPFYDGIADAGRIKQLNGSNSIWWLRSPYVSHSSLVRYVHTDGSLYNYYANYANGVSPACVII